MLALDTAYISRTGDRARNEDACGYWTSDRGGCWVVSDGAGGHGSGDRAAQIVVSTILEHFSQQLLIGTDEALHLLEVAQAAVMAEKKATETANDMHATAAVLLVDLQRCEAVWSHVGDTRIYHFRQHELLSLTRDHSLVQNMIDAGYETSADMCRNHPMRNLLTSSIGNAEDLLLTVSGAPIAIAPGDTFLICSDGWWEYVDETSMARQLAAAKNGAEWLEGMAQIVETQGGEKNDNYTAIALRISDQENEITVLLP